MTEEGKNLRTARNQSTYFTNLRPLYFLKKCNLCFYKIWKGILIWNIFGTILKIYKRKIPALVFQCKGLFFVKCKVWYIPVEFMCMWAPFWATNAGLIALQWRVWLHQQKLMKIIGDEEEREPIPCRDCKSKNRYQIQLKSTVWSTELDSLFMLYVANLYSKWRKSEANSMDHSVRLLER